MERVYTLSNSLGCDTSHFNVIESLETVAATCAFIGVKATQATNFVDPNFANTRQRAQIVRDSDGIPLRMTAYHFLNPLISGASQAQFFLNTFGKMLAGDLAPSIDAESTPGWSLNEPKVIDDFAHVILDSFGECRIYHSPGWWKGQFPDVDWSDYPSICQCVAWVAEYDRSISSPQVVAPFTDWQIWQNSEYGSVNGIQGSGSVDTDVWNGVMPQ
jgi:GH25 family lysozyme M1 (1,4-beta-N-acetylmuramidase)